jgi:hypothetical protein
MEGSVSTSLTHVAAGQVWPAAEAWTVRRQGGSPVSTAHRYRLLLAPLALGMSLSCTASQPVVDGPAPVPGQSLQDWIQDLPGARGQAIYVRNDGSTPIVITVVQLTKCENTRQRCGESHPDAVIAPGMTALLMKIEPLDDFKPFSFEYRYQWRSRR